MLACALDNLKVVRWLVADNYADFEKKDTKNGWTPLHYAAYAGNAQVCEFLLRYGADKDILDGKNMTASDWAKFMYHSEATATIEDFKPTLS